VGFFEKLTGKSNADTPLSVAIRKRYGSEQLSPQMELVDRLVETTSNLTKTQILSFESETKDFDWESPGRKEAFLAVFSASIGSGRLDAVCDYQDRITDVAENAVRRALGVRFSNESQIPSIAVETVTALYVRDWIDREITDAEFNKQNQPPYFVITERKMSLDDYLIATKPWRNFIGPIHPSD